MPGGSLPPCPRKPYHVGTGALCLSQVALLERRARQAGLEGVEVLTVDKCQGRDKQAVLLSLVRSNAEREAGEREGTAGGPASRPSERLRVATDRVDALEDPTAQP